MRICAKKQSAPRAGRGSGALAARLACLAALCLGLLLAAGCKERTAADARDAFLAAIHTGEYGAAYDMLCASAQYTQEELDALAAEGRERSTKRLTREEFANRYTAIFQELDITGLTYTVTSSNEESSLICVYDYTLSYASGKIGDAEWSFRMTVLREDGLWKIDWTPALIFPQMDWGDTVRVGTLAARRGEILADGVALAQTVDAVSVTAVPSKAGEGAQREQFVRQASVLLEMSTAEVEKALQSAYHDFTILKQYRPAEMTDSLKEQLLLIEGIGIDNGNYGTLRYYPEGQMLAHTVGYVRKITPEELEEYTGGVLDAEGVLRDPETGARMTDAAYNADSLVGKTGLERKYERALRGTDGYFIYISGTDGANKGTLYREPAQDGLDVQLTIDPDLQQRVETLMDLTFFGEVSAGAVVVMNPKTGAVQAMASWPTFDLNLFLGTLSAADYANITEFNHLLQGRYPPGSILKPFTAAAALESGAMTPHTEFPEGRGETIEDDRRWRPSDTGAFGPWKYAYITRVELNNRHKPLNMHNGILDSDNIYFAYAALRTGIEPFVAFMTGAGLTEAVEFDLAVSSAQLSNAERTWDNGLLADSAFGQGEILVTPLQAASMFCAFANNGDIPRPYVVAGTYRTEGTEYIAVDTAQPAVWKENAVAASSVATIRPMLEDVINGTAYNLNHYPNSGGKKRGVQITDVACKTGTAQVGNKEICWFVGFRTGVSAEEERLVLVMLEAPANNSTYSNMRYDIAYDLLKPAGGE